MTRVFKTPETFNHLHIREFLNSIRDLFLLSGKQVPEVFFDVDGTRTINIIGALLVYKFLDYSRHNHCFLNPKTNINTKKNPKNTITSELISMGFKKLVEENFNKPIPLDKELKFQDNGDCFISPTVLEKDTAISGYGKQNELRISNYYSYNDLIASTILSCMGEISSNFQEHAEIDTRSVIVAKGNKNHFEIACADNGIGIVSSLKSMYGKKYDRSEYILLEESIKRGVSSKLSESHMGCGLWLVNQYVTNSKGYFCMYSENAYLINKKGRIKCGESPYWKGTIVYLDIPLGNPACFADVLQSVKPKKQYI